MNTDKIKEFTDLKTWQEGHKAVLLIYEMTKKFPRDETFGLTSQIRRAVVSITSNIAEGFGRRGYKEKIQFYYLAQGSMTEVKNQILIAKDVGYISDNDYKKTSLQLDECHRFLQGLITKSKSFLNLNS